MSVLSGSTRRLRLYWRLYRPHRKRTKLLLLRAFISLTPSESQRLFLLTLVVGAVSGLVAVAFHLSILTAEELLINRAATSDGWMWLTILTPALGGLLSGLLLYYVVPGARGSGIPQVKVAYEIKGGRLPFRESIGKFLIGTLQIGSGASLGREGPTVHICAGVASVLGKTAALSQQNLRRLLPVGVAAGIAAAFNAPIAAVTFTIEEVVGDLDQTVLSGVIVAAAIAAAIERGILGEHPVFTINQSYGLHYLSSVLLYAVLGIAAAGISLTFSECLLRLRKWFAGIKTLPAWTLPSIGGVVTGVLAVSAIYFLGSGGITGGGYETLSTALSGSMTLKVMAALCLMKLAATVFSYSSGGAGGIFAPALFVGGMLGGTVGFLDVHIFNHPTDQIGAFALVGMGAVFAGVIRAPITSVLIIFEMTGSYGLILPLMISNMTSYALARHFRHLPIYEALLEQDGIFLPNRKKATTHKLEELPVSGAMTTELITLPATLSPDQALKRIQSLEYSTFPVVDDQERCIGFVSAARLKRSIAEDNQTQNIGKIAGRAVTVYPDQSISRAIMKMNQEKVLKLFVVERKSRNRLTGILSMSDIIRVQADVFSEKDDLDTTVMPEAAGPNT
ncbi:MAG: chloride channel protein [Acidobacteriota bacterium]